MKRAVGVNRHIRKACRGVASDSAAAETFQTEDDVVGNGPAGACADAASTLGRVVGSECVGTGDRAAAAGGGGGAGYFAAGKYPVGEPIVQGEDLVVPKAGIKGDFRDEVGEGLKV